MILLPQHLFFEARQPAGGMELTLASPKSTCLRWQPAESQNVSSSYNFPSILCEQQSPQGLPLVCPLGKTSSEFTKALLLMFCIA